MRESCSCGAAIHTNFYRRVLVWRATHLHNGDTELHELTALTELADSHPIGFHAYPAEEDEEN